MAVLPQLHAHAFSYTVRDTISLGRYPHQSGFFSSWSEKDEASNSRCNEANRRENV